MPLPTHEMFEVVAKVLFPMKLRRVLDLGSSNRPQKIVAAPERQVCVDPCKEALEEFKAQCTDTILRHFEFWNMTAQQALARVQPGMFDAIVLLDVIEHMEKEDGKAVLTQILSKEPRVVVVFTPYGFHPQEPHEPGGEWQRHRSGWTEEDFGGRWLFVYGEHEQGLDPLNAAGLGSRTQKVPCFFAIWIAPG